MLHAGALGKRTGGLVGAVQASISLIKSMTSMGLEFLRVASRLVIFWSFDLSVDTMANISFSFNASS